MDGNLKVQVGIQVQREGWTGNTNFHLSGFWSESSGMLCMVGTGSRTHHQFSALFKINLPRNSNISTSLAVGTLKSLEGPDRPSHFPTITVRFYAPRDYQYTLVEAPSFLESRIDCSLLHRFPVWTLDHERNCGRDRRCGPFPGHSTVSLGGVRCSEADGRVNLYVHFANHSYGIDASRSSSHGGANYNFPLRPPSTVLLAEGSWEGRRRLNLMACRVIDSWDQRGGGTSVVGNCTIGVTIELLDFATLRSRTLAVGRISSRGNDFDPVKILANNYYHPDLWEHVKYRFTRLQDAGKICKEKHPASWFGVSDEGHNSTTGAFPNMWSVQDLSISMQVVNHPDRNDAPSMEAEIFSVGETIYSGYHTLETGNVSSEVMKEMSKNEWRISYRMIVTSIHGPEIKNRNPLIINAEGYYYPGSGLLCLAGCTSYMDCQIEVTIQFRPRDSWDRVRTTNGTIRSLRKKTDPLYFEPLQMTSSAVYAKEASEAKQRMDAEMMMVVLSMTLLCLVSWKQIVHVKTHPEAAASVSLLMQVLLALGLLVPLMLDFRTLLLFTRKVSAHDLLLAAAGWMEGIVKMTMFIAQLQQLRLLQIIWTSRWSAADRNHLLSAAEFHLLLLWLPMYHICLLTAWDTRGGTRFSSYARAAAIAAVSTDTGIFLSSFFGLVLDTILLPQILLNILLDSKAKALSGVYYIGITIIRAAPHLYDAYRAHRTSPAFIPQTFIYADNLTTGTFSIHSNILLPIVGTFFAGIIFLQQKYGGLFFLPQRFRA